MYAESMFDPTDFADVSEAALVVVDATQAWVDGVDSSVLSTGALTAELKVAEHARALLDLVVARHLAVLRAKAPVAAEEAGSGLSSRDRHRRDKVADAVKNAPGAADALANGDIN